MKQVKVSEVVNDLKSGLVRYKKDDKNGFGSIEEKYDLSKKQMKILINHPSIKGIKTKKTISSLEIIDDTVSPVNEETPKIETPKKVKEPVKIDSEIEIKPKKQETFI